MKKLRLLLVSLILTISAIIIPAVGCTEAGIQTSVEPSTQDTKGIGFPLTITDQVDRLVTIEKIPEKIISLAPSSTEILFSLGLGEKVVGVTQFCNYPNEAQDKPKIGGFSQTDIDVSIEQIIAIEPHLILATETHLTEVIPRLEELMPQSAIVVLMTQVETFDAVFEAIALVGQCTATKTEADQLVAYMNNQIQAITDKTNNLPDSEKLGVLYIVWNDPIYAICGGTLGNVLIEAAGGENIFRELTGSPAVNLETIIIRNPQIILASASIGTGFDLPYQYAMTEPRLEGVDARINDRVYPINDDLTGRPGPRIVEGLELIAKMIHPKIFGAVE